MPDPPEHVYHDDNYFILHSQQLTHSPAQPHAIFIMGVGMSIRHARGCSASHDLSQLNRTPIPPGRQYSAGVNPHSGSAAGDPPAQNS